MSSPAVGTSEGHCRYRKYYLKDGVGMVVRCEHDAALPPSDPKGEPSVFINVKALNEWDPKVRGLPHDEHMR